MRHNERFANTTAEVAMPLPVNLVVAESAVPETEAVLEARAASVEFDMSYQPVVDQIIAGIPEGIYTAEAIRERLLDQVIVPEKYYRYLTAPMLQNERVVALRVPHGKRPRRELYVRPVGKDGQTDLWDDVEQVVAQLETKQGGEGCSFESCIDRAYQMGLLPSDEQMRATFQHLLFNHPRLKVKNWTVQAVLSAQEAMPPKTIGEAVDLLVARSKRAVPTLIHEWETLAFEQQRLTPAARKAFRIALAGHPRTVTSVDKGTIRYALLQPAVQVDETPAPLPTEALDKEDDDRLQVLARAVMERILDDNTVTLLTDYVLDVAARHNQAPLSTAEGAVILRYIGKRSRMERQRRDMFVERERPPILPKSMRRGRVLHIDDLSDKDYQAIMRIEQLLAADRGRQLSADK